MNISPQEWSVLSKLFDDALDIEPAERQRWIDSLPDEHAAFRKTLQDLLAAHAAVETGDFLHTVPKFSTAATDPDFSLKAGARVGPYVLETELGRGGMGAVWRARRIDGVLKRSIALKLPHPGLFTQQIAERFFLERDILAELAHRNIARLYDAGATETGQPYLALEYVEGLPLTDYCDRHRLGIRDRLGLAMQVLEAVRYAHSRLVIHRDLKPSNILVTEEGHVRLLDFGIAKLLPNNSLREAVLTEVGARALTPDYAAPELISGGEVTTATDVYSSGVVLYELLTGERPYRLQRNSLGALEDAITQGDPIRPSLATISEDHAAKRDTTVTRLMRDLAGDLDTIVLKSLRKRPDERYSTIDALRDDLERYIQGRPLLARPDSRWYAAKKFIGRHRIPIAASAVAISAVLVGATFAIVEANKATIERDRALRMSARSEAVADFLNTLVTQAAQSEKPVSVSSMLERSEKLAESEYANDADNRAAVLRMLAEYYASRDDYARAESLLRKARDDAALSSDRNLRASIDCSYGPPLARIGQREQAVRILRAVADDTRIDDEQAAMCLISLNYVAQQSNDASEALRTALEARERMRRMKSPSPTLEATILGALGDSERLNGHNDLATRYFAASIDKFTAAGRERTVEALTTRNNWSLVNDSSGDPKAGLKILDEVIALSAANDADAAPNLFYIGNRARMLYAVGRYRESIREFERCLERANGFLLAFCSIAIAGDYEDLGDLDNARRYLAQAEPLVKATSAPGSSVVLGFDLARGKLAELEHRYDDARRFLTNVVDAKRINGSTPTAYSVRADVNLHDNRPTDAIDDARKAIAFAEQMQAGKPFSNRTGVAYEVLARALLKAGKTPDAATAARSAVLHLENTVDADHPTLVAARKLVDSIGRDGRAPS